MVNKFVTFNLIILFLVNFSISFAKPLSHVTKEKIGQVYYLKRCSACHGEGNRGGNVNSINEWKEIFANNAKELIELHEGEDNVEKVIKYLKSDDFKKESPRILKLLQEFAYDSELIPTCY